MGPLHEGSIRRPIAPWANALTTELHLAPSENEMQLFFKIVPSDINPVVTEQTDLFCVEGAILDSQEVVQSSIHNIIISGKMMTTGLLFTCSGRGSSQRELNQDLRQVGILISG